MTIEEIDNRIRMISNEIKLLRNMRANRDFSYFKESEIIISIVELNDELAQLELERILKGEIYDKGRN